MSEPSQNTVRGRADIDEDDEDFDDDLDSSVASKKTKRDRGKNWDPKVIDKLAELCRENWEVLTSDFEGAGRKSKFAVTQDQKKLCWQQIADKVNSMGDERRTIGQMKQKFSKIKSIGNNFIASLVMCYL